VVRVEGEDCGSMSVMVDEHGDEWWIVVGRAVKWAYSTQSRSTPSICSIDEDASEEIGLLEERMLVQARDDCSLGWPMGLALLWVT
jgi:hypothetical protein